MIQNKKTFKIKKNQTRCDISYLSSSRPANNLDMQGSCGRTCASVLKTLSALAFRFILSNIFCFCCLSRIFLTKFLSTL